jgi:zinc D-Ala-D-Ala carboxypeptidase
VQGIAGVTARVTEIQSRMLALATGAVGTTRGTGSAASAPAASFASALADAVGGTATAPGTGAKKVTGNHPLNGKGIPTELVEYGNGRIPASALENVAGTRFEMWKPAAGSLGNLIAAAKRDGVTVGITETYRSYAEQVDIARRKGLYSQGGLAAKPGTSEHGWGMAADLDLDATALTWMRKHAGEYGFTEDTPREPWHWGFKP